MTVTKVRNIAGSHRAKLLTLARDQGEDFQFLLGRWVVERFLYLVMRLPVMRSIPPRQCEPISARHRERPPSAEISRQFQSVS